ncbi:MAG TPA: DUF6428 family protein [Terracidiphilus sp.]|jgi:hypothetical protein
MKLSEFKSHLLVSTNHEMRFVLPDGDLIPAHAHVTEVGRVDKNFIDCGGTSRSWSNCTLQVWVAENDEQHRLPPAKLAAVMDMGAALFRGEDLEVEIEYEDCCTELSQYPVLAVEQANGTLTFKLGSKHTDCLAKESCGLSPAGEQSGCCGGNC